MEFEPAGYEDLRTYIQNNWTHLALVNSNGVEETRIDVAGDSRVFWDDTPNTNPMTLSATVQGSNSDINTPTTLVRAELYTSSSATTRMAADPVPSPTPTLEAANDEVTLTIDVHEPL